MNLTKNKIAFATPKFKDIAINSAVMHFYCPGCKTIHGINVKQVGGQPLWKWDGNKELPTIVPSVKSTLPAIEGRLPKHICHLFLKAGKLQFLNDCTHELKGQTVDLPVLPEYMQEEEVKQPKGDSKK